jgi:hypothetical protein
MSSNMAQAERNKRRNKGNEQLMSPKEGGRGLKNKEEPRDKVVRVRSSLYNKILNSELGRKIRLESLNADFDDVLTEVWEFYEEKHRKP